MRAQAMSCAKRLGPEQPRTEMTIRLPAAIAEYFETDYSSSVSANCFASDAVVKDEGKTYIGREVIRGWMIESWEKYAAIATPISVDVIGNETVVTAHTVGNFPGSPLNLRFHFTLNGDKIAALRTTS